MELSVVFAVLVGGILKSRLKAEVMRKAIPFFVFASQFVGRLVLEVQPAEAAFLGGLFAKLGPSLLDIARDSAVSTLLGVGAHSTWKNSGKQLWNAVQVNALKKVVGEPDQPQK